MNERYISPPPPFAQQKVCRLCGAMVTDEPVHDAWHKRFGTDLPDATPEDYRYQTRGE